MKDTLLTALPLFFAAVFGVYLRFSLLDAASSLYLLAGILMLGLIARGIAAQTMASAPVLAVRIWQAEALVPMAVIAAAGFGLAHLADALPGWIAALPGLRLDPDAAARQEQVKTIDGVFSAAITALASALLLDDAKSVTGGRWPPAQIRKAMRAAFIARLPAHKTREVGGWDAAELGRRLLEDEVISQDHRPGWSYSAAIERARLILQVVG